MWLIIIIVVIAIIAFFVKNSSDSGSSSTSGYSRSGRPTYTATSSRPSYSSGSQKPRTVTQCVDRTADTMYRLDSTSANVCRQVSTARTKAAPTIQNITRTQSLTVDLSWMSSLESTLESAYILKQNLSAQSTGRLNQTKFHYYTSLHFRSMIAANLVYEEYAKADKTLDQMGKIIVGIGKREIRVTQAEKTQLYDVKDIVKVARKSLLESVQSLNHLTHDFKEKIYHECGERGQDWYKKMNSR